MRFPRGKFLLFHILGILFLVSIGYFVGKTTVDCSKSVLGVSSPDSKIIQLAELLKSGIERPSSDYGAINDLEMVKTTPELFPDQPDPTKTLILEPTSIPIVLATSVPIIKPTFTPIPIIKPTSTPASEPGMYWAGSNRGGNATTVPTKVVTPTIYENTDVGGNTKTKPSFTPSPAYKANFDRFPASPTPTIEKLPESEEMFNDPQNNQRKPPVTPSITPTAKPPEPLKPAQMEKIVSLAGINMEKPEVTTSKTTPGFTIKGAIKDKIFGIAVSYPIVVKVNENSGEIEDVSIPWWRTLFGNPFLGGISQIRCGDGICSSKEDYNTCKEDCTPVCGNGICEYGEGTDTCPTDCGVLPTIEPTIAQ